MTMEKEIKNCFGCGSMNSPFLCPNCSGNLYPKDNMGKIEQPCLHDSCAGCQTGTCSGMHMISCPCPKCSPRC